LRLKIRKRGISGKTPRKNGMANDGNTPSVVEQAVSRALRENLERLQRNSDELHQAVNDVVAACGSSRPTNALPPMLRAQATAASLSAALDVLARFVAASVQASVRPPFEAEMARLAAATQVIERPPAPPRIEKPAAEVIPAAPPIASPPAQSAEGRIETAPTPLEHTPTFVEQAAPAVHAPLAVEPQEAYEFDVNRLSTEEQELHRRANRVAKVSMQDIKMLRPEQVRLGRENKDICIRLKDDIEKAHREYDRRFKPIMDHPVDYFYRWMVEILAEGDSHALGEYPYAPVRQRQ
jgi:hypothetical protein